MSEQDGTRSSTKYHRSRKTNTANQRDGKQARAAQRPANEDTEAWKSYWGERGQPWRTEPEIDVDRQQFLEERRKITPDIEKGIYPFKDIKLNRADVEWLLATNENGRGPVYWSDVREEGRRGLDLRGANLRQVDLTSLPLSKMVGGPFGDEWPDATEKQREMAAIQLQGARFIGTHLEAANLRFAHLENAYLVFTHLERTHLRGAHLIGADFREAYLQKVRLEDEYEARQKQQNGIVKEKAIRLDEYEKAVRANRQLAVVLRDQGLNEIGARFAYRAQLLQRKVFWYQRKFGQYLFSLFLALLTGYGYKPLRSFIAYALVISLFATIYFLLGSPLAWNEALVISMTAFHGRGLFPDQFHPGDPQALVAAIEAFVGLLIEVTFIATLTQRLFGK